MSVARRHEQILEIVRRQVYADVDSLASRFSVTQQTIRRDINDLAARGLVRRYHGGAGLPSTAENIDYATRQVLNRGGKESIADLVADQIPDCASLFLNLGTTTEAVARRLAHRRDLRVITNNLNVACILGGNPNIEVIVAGGIVRARDLGITGEATMAFVRQFKVDFGVIGISAVELDGTLRDFDMHEIQISRVIIEQSRQVLLVADHTKFERHALVRLGHISEIDALFTDAPPPEELARVLDDGGVRVVRPGNADTATQPHPLAGNRPSRTRRSGAK